MRTSTATTRVSRRSLVRLIGLAAPLTLTLAACGEVVSEPEPTPAPEITEEPLGDNLAAQLPAMPEMRAGRTDHLEQRTETGRFDRAVYFSELTPGHVLNFYLDEMPALGWKELSRSELSARGGELEYESPNGTQHLLIKVERRARETSSAVLELTTTRS
ncbi:MAG: hypothetical protein OXG65_07550 [Chloroflexi bacterium]|nr:hypothetical protein [Chloroflexota bacterium]